jgi:predicted branched-subunit amino acid permease
MRKRLRHLFLIFGSVAIVFGVMMFLTSAETKQKYLISGGLFAGGAYLVMRALSNTEKIKRRDVDIKSKMLEKYKKEEGEN